MGVTNPGWREPVPTYWQGRSSLDNLTGLGIVERRHDPTNPREPLVRMKTRKELEELDARIAAARARREAAPVCKALVDADGNHINVPLDRADEAMQLIIAEARRREIEAHKEHLASLEDETFVKRRWTAEDRRARADRHRADLDALVRAP
jgi:hypothetical protein